MTEKIWSFELEVGRDSIGLPHGFGNPAEVWITDIRRRKILLSRLTREKFDEQGRSYRVGRNDEPVHLRGMPIHYKVQDGQLFLWPVPAHAWTVCVRAQSAREQNVAVGREVLTQQKVRGDFA